MLTALKILALVFIGHSSNDHLKGRKRRMKNSTNLS
jgi:hypothetical protein